MKLSERNIRLLNKAAANANQLVSVNLFHTPTEVVQLYKAQAHGICMLHTLQLAAYSELVVEMTTEQAAVWALLRTELNT